MKPVSWAKALSECRCPQCREGMMFMHPGWQLHKATRMHETCPHCGLKFEIEPGFFLGSHVFQLCFWRGAFGDFRRFGMVVFRRSCHLGLHGDDFHAFVTAFAFEYALQQGADALPLWRNQLSQRQLIQLVD